MGAILFILAIVAICVAAYLATRDDPPKDDGPKMKKPKGYEH